MAIVVIVFRVDGSSQATLELYVLLYLLLLGQPAVLLGSGFVLVICGLNTWPNFVPCLA